MYVYSYIHIQNGINAISGGRQSNRDIHRRMMTWRVPDSRRDEAARRLLQQVPHTATHCGALQITATLFNALQNTAMQHIATL